MKRTQTFSIEELLRKEVKHIAVDLNRSMSSIVEEALKDWLEKQTTVKE